MFDGMDNSCKSDILHNLVKVLREQCPWDREQDVGSLRKHLIEETHEVLEAIEAARLRDEWQPLRDELGDLLFQIAFLSRLAEEAGAFGLDDVFDALLDKMIRRHPHVFGDEVCESAEANESRWERMKEDEHKDRRSLMDGIPPLPALARAQKLQQRAARVGFDWPQAADVLAKIREELEELAQEMKTGDQEAMEDEFGDVLFAAVNLARKLGIDAELALMRSNRKFIRRFRGMEALAERQGVALGSLDAGELETLYRMSKQQEEDS